MNTSAELSEGIHPKLRSAESQERFNEKIEEAFTMAGDREPIGEVLDYLASVAFEEGLGRDQAARQITASDAFKRKGLVEGPLKACIMHEIEAAYGNQRGRRKFSRDQKSAARQELEAFLEHMNPHRSVTGFFRDLVHGRTNAGPVLTDSVSTTVSKGDILGWATGRRTTEVIKRRFKAMVQPVIAEKYRKHIKSKPEEYIANFLNDVLVFQMIGDPPCPHAEFKIGNLRELFLDIADAVDFERFWRILSGHTEASRSELNDIPGPETSITDFLNIDLWRSSIELIWKEVKTELRQRNGSRRPSSIPPEMVVRGVADDVRREAAAVSRLFFVIVPPGADGGAAESKMTVEIQNRRGEHVGRALVKPNIRDSSPDHIRRFVRTLLTGDGSLARFLRSQGIHLNKDGPEVHALANQLGSYSPLRLPYSNGRRKRSRR